MASTDTVVPRVGMKGRGPAAALSFVIFAAMALVIASPAMPSEWSRLALRQVVDLCALVDRSTGQPFPCQAVRQPTEGGLGYAQLHSPGFPTESLLVPIAHIDGIESPILESDAATPLWAAAWRARGAVASQLGAPLARADVALAVNARGTRTQDQFHIHVDCVSLPISAAIARRQAYLSPAWSLFPDRLRGEHYWARSIRSSDLVDVNVLRLVTRGLPGAGQDMARVTLAVIPQVLSDGSDGFVLLANAADRSAERLLDHGCHGRGAPDPAG